MELLKPYISDSSVKASEPLQSKSISKTVVQQLVSIFVDVQIEDVPPVPQDNCPEGTKLNTVNGKCEPSPPPVVCGEGEILQGNDCVPGFAPCGPEWSYPCPGTKPESTPEEPVAPQQPTTPTEEPEPESEPQEGNLDQNTDEGDGGGDNQEDGGDDGNGGGGGAEENGGSEGGGGGGAEEG